MKIPSAANARIVILMGSVLRSRPDPLLVSVKVVNALTVSPAIHPVYAFETQRSVLMPLVANTTVRRPTKLTLILSNSQ